jgi:hypothetical protein
MKCKDENVLHHEHDQNQGIMEEVNQSIYDFILLNFDLNFSQMKNEFFSKFDNHL